MLRNECVKDFQMYLKKVGKKIVQEVAGVPSWTFCPHYLYP